MERQQRRTLFAVTAGHQPFSNESPPIIEKRKTCQDLHTLDTTKLGNPQLSLK